jgi:hypothetical protein
MEGIAGQYLTRPAMMSFGKKAIDTTLWGTGVLLKTAFSITDTVCTSVVGAIVGGALKFSSQNEFAKSDLQHRITSWFSPEAWLESLTDVVPSIKNAFSKPRYVNELTERGFDRHTMSRLNESTRRHVLELTQDYGMTSGDYQNFMGRGTFNPTIRESDVARLRSTGLTRHDIETLARRGTPLSQIETYKKTGSFLYSE